MMKRMIIGVIVSMFLGSMVGSATAQDEKKQEAAAVVSKGDAETKSVALTPVDKKDDWWQKRFAEKNEQLKKGDAELLLIGDSITHGWDDGNAKESREKFIDQWKWVNLGFSGDRTEHVLWRLEHAPMDAVKPKAIMLMIGTNNIGHESSTPKDTADGIKAIVDKLQQLYPEAKLLVLNVFPRGAKKDDGMRKKVDEINAYLPDLLKGKKNVTLLDINAIFLAEDGTLPKEIMPDFLHPKQAGYMLWGEKVSPELKKMIAP